MKWIKFLAITPIFLLVLSSAQATDIPTDIIEQSSIQIEIESHTPDQPIDNSTARTEDDDLFDCIIPVDMELEDGTTVKGTIKVDALLCDVLKVIAGPILGPILFPE